MGMSSPFGASTQYTNQPTYSQPTYNPVGIYGPPTAPAGGKGGGYGIPSSVMPYLGNLLGGMGYGLPSLQQPQMQPRPMVQPARQPMITRPAAAPAAPAAATTKPATATTTAPARVADPRIPTSVPGALTKAQAIEKAKAAGITDYAHTSAQKLANQLNTPVANVYGVVRQPVATAAKATTTAAKAHGGVIHQGMTPKLKKMLGD